MYQYIHTLINSRKYFWPFGLIDATFAPLDVYATPIGHMLHAPHFIHFLCIFINRNNIKGEE